MRKRTSVLLVLLLLAILPLQGCLGGDTSAPTPAAPATIPQLQAEINTLKATVSTLNGQVANLSSQVAGMPSGVANSTANTTALEASIVTLQAQIVELTDRIAELEAEEGESGNGNVSEETTRWTITAGVECTDYTLADLVDIEWRPTRISENDDYATIYLTLHNLSCVYNEIEETYYCIPIAIDTLYVTFRPRSGDRVKIDADDTFMDSYSRPYLDWETDVTTRSDGSCRKINAVSYTPFVLPIPSSIDTLGNPEPYILKLEFELRYLD